ncbi:putative lanthionine biosynthesis protein [Streptomyces sp. NBRC 110611]|uniref:lantibiotic dehydratase n=1 Tax=Streptomyces sp. NBRC 110611 TaxID=1621259 RepID=UPI0008578D29|nr:lantibiotic dehydratase [Streptomyces sp. NBRC 110611]GAU70600.1 putative lanthionine biosynthesis protein [Streptomyces sp. NBRC 110611]
MDSRNGGLLYRSADVALVRATRYAKLPLPAWPDFTDDSPGQVRRWQTWLREVWAIETVTEAIEHASPLLARQVEAMCSASAPEARQLRRTLVSVIRYVLRMTGRATPHGLFAGIAPVSFGSEPSVAWGDWHRAIARADAAWISDVITRLEACPALLQRLPVMANTTAFVRGDRLIVPYPPRSRRTGSTRPAEVSLRLTSAVRIAVDAARAPIRFAELVDTVRAEFPEASAPRVAGLVTSLVHNSALISSLHAPSATLDALDHLVKQAEAADAGDVPLVADLIMQLRAVRDGMVQHNQALTPTDGRRLRTGLRDKMRAMSSVADQPVAVDLRMDCSLVLPSSVAREAEKAASALARLTAFPFGTPAWKDFHNRFFERYGVGSLVPVLDVVDPDAGLGFPAGYLDAEPEQREALSPREQQLLSLAQAAALDGRDEIQLDEDLINDLTVGDQEQMQLPPHLELRFQLHATSPAALAEGDFALTALGPSRGIGTTSGRFLGLLDPTDQARAASVLEQLPVAAPGALPTQVSFAPLDRSDAHVTRAPELLPAVISLAEHRPPDARTIALDDLAVGCDRSRLYLASLSRGCLLDPITLHALDLRAHTPPLARFLVEISRSQCAVLTPFPWIAAATLPFLPRVRYGRAVLSPARWRLNRSDVADRRASWEQWNKAVEEWRTRRRVPEVVALTDGDRLLPLDLSESAHLVLLRAHLETAESAVLTEAGPDGGWFEGRAHEVVVPMTAACAPQWPKVPPVTIDRVLTRDHGYLPGASPWLLVKLYGHVERHAEILAHHLPGLLAKWDEPPTWWYMRYRDPRWHLRLRVATPEPADFETVASRVSAWAAQLRRRGLLSDMQFATSYPEAGRWGAGQLMRLAEEVFAADSRTLAVQFAQPNRPHPQALAAANFVSLAAAFTGSTQEGMDWLITYGRITDPRPLDRQVLGEAVRLADPTDDWAALRAAAGGPAVVAAWADRDQAVARYRAQLREADGIDPNTVLDSLLHAHHIRTVGIDKDDERTCVRLARAAALAWRARRG